MSNELSTPTILLCPEDRHRVRATNFESDLTDSRISYFVGVDATETNRSLFLCGDRNLTNDSPRRGHLVLLPAQTPVRWTAEVHKRKGNLLFSDGSVQVIEVPSFKTPVGAVNRLSMP